ncbi:MAG: hypothetical protein F6K19_41035 [Cyanothece sp. SIO1E1]|nr:hypothetical protein [Cyanothece sp. SIO1E1]
MVKPSNQPLKSNPFITYRDRTTGEWLVQLPASAQVGLDTSPPESDSKPLDSDSPQGNVSSPK